MSGQHHNDEIKALVREAWDSGCSASIVASQLKSQLGVIVTRSAVLGLVSRMKLKKRQEPRLRLPRHPHAPAAPKPMPSSHKPEEPVPCGPVGDFPKLGLCRWPHGEGLEIQCCGHPAVMHGPYCEFHQAIAYVRTQPQQFRGRKNDRQYF
jgi:hypothetical protein